jgi:chemotaxis protein methyltransferase CheR
MGRAELMPAPRRQPAAPELASDADFPALKQLVIQQTGHFYYSDKDQLLWERLLRRFRQTGSANSAAYLRRLQDPQSGDDEWAALAAEITIGETFFFRYAEQFAALRQTILPDLLRQNRGQRSLRLWSAGCANGAEPYSLAILLRQLLGDAVPDWRLSVLGTDLNEDALRQARLGLFSRWSLRGQPVEQLEQDFEPADQGRRWLLRPQHRTLVQFRRHNLLSLLDNSAPLELNEFDLILCRNVLIYFHPDTVQALVRAMAARLRPGGWLLLGHAEPNPSFAHFLQVVELPGTVAYRRAPLPDVTSPPGPPAATATEALPAPAPAPPKPPPRRPTPALLPVPSSDAASTLPALAGTMAVQARAAADRGDLDTAARACRAALEAAPTVLALHQLDGLVARAQGRVDDAEAAFRRAIYLKRDFAMAHYQLGLLLLDEGRRTEGRRALAAAARLVTAWPGGTLLEEGDGMTARQLHAGVRLQLDALGDRVG